MNAFAVAECHAWTRAVPSASHGALLPTEISASCVEQLQLAAHDHATQESLAVYP